MSFTNKVVLVTGASSGIGMGIAILFAKEGANVVLVGRKEINLKNTAEKCGPKTFIIVADISNDADAKRVIKETIDKFGKLDILVNNAGILKQGSIVDGKGLEAYDEIMAINVRAVFHLTTLAAPYLAKTKGNIVNISSITALTVTSPNMIAYSMSKASLDHFTRIAALELSSSGIRVNSVNPGPVKTEVFTRAGYESWDWDILKPLTALGRVSEPHEIADLVCFLASEKAKGITGSIVVSDNGCLLKNFAEAKL